MNGSFRSRGVSRILIALAVGGLVVENSLLRAQTTCAELGDPRGNGNPDDFCIPTDPGAIGGVVGINIANSTFPVPESGRLEVHPTFTPWFTASPNAPVTQSTTYQWTTPVDPASLSAKEFAVNLRLDPIQFVKLTDSNDPALSDSFSWVLDADGNAVGLTVTAKTITDLPWDDGIGRIHSIIEGLPADEQVSFSTQLAGGTVVPVRVSLRPGDADQDLDFDQSDLVRVQQANKYLSGDAATWGEGDWDGGPGGSPGAPPAGNGIFDQFDIIAAQQAAIYQTGSYAAIRPGGMEDDGQTSIVYDATTGEIAVDAPAGTELTSINVDSATSIFTGDSAANLGGSFDNDADNNIFKATFGGCFASLSFGNVAQAGLSEEFVLNDLTAVGSLNGGGALGDVDLVYIPEPSTLALLLLGLVAAFSVRNAAGTRR